MASPQLDKRTGVYCIRIGIPESLRGYFKEHYGKSWEWKHPLADPDTGEQARSPREAKRLWPSYLEEWETAKEAAAAAVNGKGYELSDRKADALCADWLAQQLAAYGDTVPDELERELTRATFTDFLEVDQHSETRSVVRLRQHLKQRSYIADEAAHLFDLHRIPIPRGSEPFIRFCERLAWTGVELVGVLDARAVGDWSEPEAIKNAPTLDSRVSVTGEKISQLYEWYKVERNLSDRQRMEHDNPIDAFTAQHGDLPLTRVTPAHVRAYKDSLVEASLAPTTISGRLSVLRRLFSYAVENAVISENPAASIKASGGRKARRLRKPWTVDELQTILDGPVHRGGSRPPGGQGEAAFWLPLLGIYTGARLEDLAQLLLEDIRETTDGAAFIDINDNHGKQVKNDSTPRQVPLHAELLRLGFLRYVAELRKAGQGEGQKVFPGLETYRGQAAKAWGSWFGRYKRKLLPKLSKDIMKDFQSFRHAFKDAARESGIPADQRDRLQGHRTPGVAETYGDGYSLKALKKAIDKLNYEGLDTSNIKSRWV